MWANVAAVNRGSSRGLVILAVAGMMCMVLPFNASAEGALPSYDRVRVFESPRHISNFELQNGEEDSIRLSDMQGKVVFLFFGFTNCPDVCPTAMAKFRQLQASGNVGDDDISYVLISIDPDRDSPAVLTEYLSKFSDQFIGLTGDGDAIKAVAKEFSVAYYAEGTKADSQYNVSHSPQSFVLDTTGRLRAEMYNPSIEAMAGIAHALLQESSAGAID